MRSGELFRLAGELDAAGKPFVVATVVRAQSPTSAKAGDKAILTEDGMVLGWVGGSCAEPTVRAEALAALRDGESRLLHLSPEPELPASRRGLTFASMTCFSGGAMEIYIEPHLPEPRLLVFGQSPVARALVELGTASKLRVTAVDLSGEPPLAGGDASTVRSLDELPSFSPASTYAVVATHGSFEDAALAWLLARQPAYVGLVTSRRRFRAVRSRLVERGVAADAVGGIRAPAGLDIGARQPEEVALSILAEIVALRRGAGDPPWAAEETIDAEPAADDERVDSAPTAGPGGGGGCCHGEPSHD